jgi:biopolymer transport protein ExbD
MARIRKSGKRKTPGVSTSSLPDIVFMLLFFFMVATRMREITLQVNVTKPEATQSVKVEDRSLVVNVYVGKPTRSEKYGTEPRVQLDDAITDVKAIGPYVLDQISKKPQVDQNRVFVSIKADEKISTGIITDIKEELRDVNALLVNYSSRKTAVLE